MFFFLTWVCGVFSTLLSLAPPRRLHSKFYSAFKQTLDLANEYPDLALLLDNGRHAPTGEHPGRFNAPIARNEVGAIITNGRDGVGPGQIVISARAAYYPDGREVQTTLNRQHEFAPALTYPLLLPYGTPWFEKNTIKNVNKAGFTSRLEFLRHVLSLCLAPLRCRTSTPCARIRFTATAAPTPTHASKTPLHD